MRRIIVILVVVAVGGYFVYDYFQGKAKEKTAQETRQKKMESRRAAVAQMVAKYNAANDWDKLLKGSASKRKKILTMELENLWLTNKPILFKGRIKDISTLDAGNYLMTLDRRSIFSTNLALTLNSPKTMIDSFLSTHPDASSALSIVAVIAKINKIETKYRQTEEGDKEEIKTGVGQCIDILMYSDFYFEDMLEDLREGKQE